MIAQEFSSTGWQVHRPAAGITHYQVFGERSSGTNFVKRLIGRNTPLAPTEELGWKHGFPQMTAIPQDTLIVCVIRNAVDWARSMHAKPWHCPPEMQRLAFSDFIRAEWATIADRPRYFPQVAALGGAGQPLQHDRHPLTGLPFPDLFTLRRAKLMGLTSFFNRGCALLFCRLEAVQAAPEGFLSELCGRFGLPETGDFQPVHKRLGSRFKPAIEEPRPTPPAQLSREDIDFLCSRLDLGLEAALGYSY
ncbi:hypothetical protein [Alloyangia pacifica]|uniref:Sulfotransferase family protein n=1 Tax=Alloyangia pacifica TaxID=311180 RepID=A0A1I6VPU7_9RHOB|nr:hypothetical protein [Alloyangia pacifica]SDI08821.1 hypothetical protein SAMN04488245_112100 [Alloyangia pacifica]SFT15736.1 hypothetical protein SAMN04488050_112100 [Alloyangia pacifica]